MLHECPSTHHIFYDRFGVSRGERIPTSFDRWTGNIQQNYSTLKKNYHDPRRNTVGQWEYRTTRDFWKYLIIISMTINTRKIRPYDSSHAVYPLSLPNRSIRLSHSTSLPHGSAAHNLALQQKYCVTKGEYYARMNVPSTQKTFTIGSFDVSRGRANTYVLQRMGWDIKCNIGVQYGKP